jgi:hypothetical protein
MAGLLDTPPLDVLILSQVNRGLLDKNTILALRATCKDMAKHLAIESHFDIIMRDQLADMTKSTSVEAIDVERMTDIARINWTTALFGGIAITVDLNAQLKTKTDTLRTRNTRNMATRYILEQRGVILPLADQAAKRVCSNTYRALSLADAHLARTKAVKKQTKRGRRA